MTKGKFINLVLDYTKHSETHLAQQLLNLARTQITNGSKGVGYIYSANYGQTREIERAYFAQAWNTGTSGDNQAKIVMAVEHELGQPAYQDLQGKVHVLPITTMNAYVNPIANWSDDLHLGLLNEDLDRTENYLKSNWDVFGIQDPNHTVKKPYAIGGKIANMPPSVSNFVQQFLIGLKGKY